MSNKKSLIWIIFLLLIVALKASEFDSGEDENFSGIDLVDQNHGTANTDNQNNHEQDDQNQAYGLNGELADPETIFNAIVAGIYPTLPELMLFYLPPEYVFSVLLDETGAKLAAARPNEVFAESNLEILDRNFNDIHGNFFLNLDLFSPNVGCEVLSRIPSRFVVKAIQVQSLAGKFNFKRFIKIFASFEESLHSNLPKLFTLPHFFDINELKYPFFNLRRGITYEHNLSKKDLMIWDISLQLFFYRIVNEKNCRASQDFSNFVNFVKQEMNSARRHLKDDIDFNMNYFGLKDIDGSLYPDGIHINVLDIFGSTKLYTLKERAVSINELGEALGLPNFLGIDYKTLDFEQKIFYRLIIHLTIYNPSLLPKGIRNDLLFKFFATAPSDDFSELELFQFASDCFNLKLSDFILKFIRKSGPSSFRNILERMISSLQTNFDLVVGGLTNEMDRYYCLKRGTFNLDQALLIKNEDFYYERHLSRIDLFKKQQQEQQEQEELVQLNVFTSVSSPSAASVPVEEEDMLIRTKRLRNGEKAPETNVPSHFLESKVILSLETREKTDNREKSFIVPYVDKNYFNARFDNLMQNLESSGFGEIEWKKMVTSIEVANERVAYEQHEKDLNEFVRLTYQAIDYMRKYPRATVNIYFRGSPSYGDGLKFEALEMFARAILLPQFKVFYYSTKLKGFIPYPLLHQDLMFNLGYLNQWFLTNNLPLSWNLAEDYIKFLFYEENPLDSMQSVIEHFYEPIFANLEGLQTPGINPLEYFPTTLFAHQPLAGYGSAITSTYPLDLFEPTDSSNNPHYMSLFDYLSEDDNELLSKYIEPPNYDSFDETKEEKELIESKEGNDMEIVRSETQTTYINENENLYSAQLKLKTDIIEVMKHSVSREIIGHLLIGRFAFMKTFLQHFNSYAQQFVTSKLYLLLQEAQAKEITADLLISGLYFSDPREDIIVKDINEKEYTPVKTLEYVLRSLEPELMKTFYWFCTGCITLPLSGLKSKPIGVTVTDMKLLPASRTCFRSLTLNLNPDLKLHEHVEAMRTAILKSAGFHVDEKVRNTGDYVGTFADVQVSGSGEPNVEIEPTISNTNTNAVEITLQLNNNGAEVIYDDGEDFDEDGLDEDGLDEDGLDEDDYDEEDGEDEDVVN